MKRTVRLALLGAVLHAGAQAEELAAKSAPAAVPDEAKAAVARPPSAAPKKSKTVQRKKPRVTAKNSEIAPKRDGVAETPAEQQEQPVQLKGVRG